MKPLGILALLAQFAPRVLQIRRGTWIALGLGVLAFMALMIWLAVMLLGWLWGQGRTLAEGAPEAARSVVSQVEQVVPGAREAGAAAAAAAAAQVEQVVPGAREAAAAAAAQVEQVVPGARAALENLVPGGELPRDVSGTDIGPVVRYPGLVRTHWERAGQTATVRHEGRADYAAVLEHYAQGFAGKGYAQSVLSASPDSETHEYRKGDEVIRFTITRLSRGLIQTTLVAVLP